MKMINTIHRFLKEEDGATAVEYGVMVALIIAVCIAVVQTIGTKVDSAFDTVDGKLPAAQ